VLNLRLSQAYDIRQERDDQLSDPEPFSDLRTELTLRPTAASLLTVDAYTQVYDTLKFTRFTAGAGYDDGHGDLARVDYLYRDADVAGDATEYVGAELATSRFDPLHLRLGERYDFNEEGTLENLVGLEYRAKCWSLFLTFRDRPGNTEVLLGFALSGLGQVNGFGSTLQPLREQP
jgi:LPS-assembly protein